MFLLSSLLSNVSGRNYRRRKNSIECVSVSALARLPRLLLRCRLGRRLRYVFVVSWRSSVRVGPAPGCCNMTAFGCWVASLRCMFLDIWDPIRSEGTVITDCPCHRRGHPSSEMWEGQHGREHWSTDPHAWFFLLSRVGSEADLPMLGCRTVSFSLLPVSPMVCISRCWRMFCSSSHGFLLWSGLRYASPGPGACISMSACP